MKTVNHRSQTKRPFFNLIFIFIGIAALGHWSCKKYLDQKPDKKIAIPSSVEDMKDILNNYESINARLPSLGEVGADNYYVTDATWASLNDRYRDFYLWQKNDDIGGEWTAPYNVIFNANIILEVLDKLPDHAGAEATQIQGSALFIRALFHFALSQLFAPPFDPATSADDAGIPLMLHSNYSVLPGRSTVSENYKSILTDLGNAVRKLPESPSVKYYPSRPAAYGLLARVYLSMREYDKAGLYADSCLQLYSALMDYNDINSSASIPFSQFNDEVIYDAATSASTPMIQSRAKVDTVLYQAYDSNDLRKKVFFKTNSDGSVAFKGNYNAKNSSSLFAGIATDEMYLTRAESEARSGNLQKAVDDVNTLLRKRWASGKYTDFISNDASEILRVILEERRKELAFRTLRWTDLRRLNMEPDFAKSIFRKINGDLYELEPGSPRYTFQIDKKSVDISGLQQNP
jgi:tetratricopeptide (TPR) repeat protein